MRKVVFTVCLGDYDDIPLLLPVAGYDHVLITDNPSLKPKGWDVLLVKLEKDILKQSRLYKICPHRFIDADVFVYLDANHEIRRDLKPLLDNVFKGGYMAVRHGTRDCVYEEAERIKALKKAPAKIVNAQVKAYRQEGMPERTGLFANGFFVRDRSFDAFCERWYQETEKHSHRDQLSMAYMLWKYEPQITVLDHAIKNQYMRVLAHKDGSKARPDIWYFVPGAGDKDYGAALNRHIELVPSDEDWILIRDNDTCFLNPYINKQLEDIVAKHGHKYDLLSCYTNRLGLAWQLPFGLSDNPNVLHHKAIADRFYKDHYDDVIPSDKPTAGLFMLFPKRAWQNNKFPPGLADGNFIDYQFAQGILKNGGRVGICKGVYLFHYYRMDKNVSDITHLKSA